MVSRVDHPFDPGGLGPLEVIGYGLFDQRLINEGLGVGILSYSHSPLLNDLQGFAGCRDPLIAHHRSIAVEFSQSPGIRRGSDHSGNEGLMHPQPLYNVLFEIRPDIRLSECLDHPLQQQLIVTLYPANAKTVLDVGHQRLA